ncbi:MAG: hypothetical protein K2Y40_10460 [Reyranella sp.]|nr:hypothetical protein [Reyranella sp.]
MPTTILEQTKTHPPHRGFGRRGQDTWEFDIPPGQQLASVELMIEEAGPDCGARIGAAPSAGATGHGRADINWWYSTSNAVRYRIKVTTEPAEPDAVVVESRRFAHGASRFSPVGRSGTDAVRIEAPAGHSLVGADLVFVHRRRGGAALRGVPLRGSTGTLRMLVDWTAGRFGGRVEYFLRATFEPFGPVAFIGETPTFTPNPVVAGMPFTLSVVMTNFGMRAISRFLLKAEFHVESLSHPLGAVYLQYASDEQRTVRQARFVDFDPAFEPGTQRTVARSETFPLALPSVPDPLTGNVLTPTTRGTYKVTVGVDAFTPDNFNVERVQVFNAEPLDLTVV